MLGGLLVDFGEVDFEVLDKVMIEILTEQVCFLCVIIASLRQ